MNAQTWQYVPPTKPQNGLRLVRVYDMSPSPVVDNGLWFGRCWDMSHYGEESKRIHHQAWANAHATRH